MPEEIVGEDGEKKTVYSEDEVKDLKAGHDANKAKKEELASTQKELEETREKLGKLENKDFNFKRLRDLDKEKQAKLTEAEKALMLKAEELENNQKSFTDKLITSYQDEAIAVLVGNDEKLRKKVLHNYSRIKGDAVTKEEVNSKMRDAFNMTGVGSQAPSAISSINSLSGSAPNPNPSGDTKLDEGQKDLGKKLGLTDEEMGGKKQ